MYLLFCLFKDPMHNLGYESLECLLIQNNSQKLKSLYSFLRNKLDQTPMICAIYKELKTPEHKNAKTAAIVLSELNRIYNVYSLRLQYDQYSEQYRKWHRKTIKKLVLRNPELVIRRKLITDSELIYFKSLNKHLTDPIIELLDELAKQKILVVLQSLNGIHGFVLFDDQRTNSFLKQHKFLKLIKHWSAMMPIGGGFQMPDPRTFEDKSCGEFKFYLSNFMFLSMSFNLYSGNNIAYFFTQSEIRAHHYWLEDIHREIMHIVITNQLRKCKIHNFFKLFKGLYIHTFSVFSVS